MAILTARPTSEPGKAPAPKKAPRRIPPLLIPALAILSVAFIAMAVSPMAYADDPAPQEDIIDTDEVMDIIMGVIPILFLVGILYYIGTSLASGRVTGSGALAMVMAATVAVIVFVFLILPAIGGNRTHIQPPLGGLDLRAAPSPHGSDANEFRCNGKKVIK